MYCVKLHKTMNQFISLFYRLGIWNRGDESTVRETGWKLFLSIYYLLFPVSLLVGALLSDNMSETIFLLECAILSSVLTLKLFYIIWKKKQFLQLINRICVYTVNDLEDFTFVNDKLKYFMNFVYILLVPSFLGASCIGIFTPFITSERRLFLAIGFPLDWKNNEFAYWIAAAFIFTQMFFTCILMLFTPIFSYLMLHCGLKYEVLGNQIRKMGEIKIIETTGRQRKIATSEKESKFLGDLIEATQFHHRIREEIQEMASFLSTVFLAKLAISAICICIAIYCLVFRNSGNLIEYVIYITALFYNLFEIFMDMYFGNKIKSSSDRLTYCLFESNWCEQPQSSKKCCIIFAEIIKQPYTLVVGKLYPLTLETYTRILNSAYSMFNILRSFE